jgi:hypothetical protein
METFLKNCNYNIETICAKESDQLVRELMSNCLHIHTKYKIGHFRAGCLQDYDEQLAACERKAISMYLKTLPKNDLVVYYAEYLHGVPNDIKSQHFQIEKKLAENLWNIGIYLLYKELSKQELEMIQHNQESIIQDLSED